MKNLVKSDLFDVIGLEARDRVGGRVYTNEHGNEIGAAWIHGTTLEYEDGTTEENPVMQTALECVSPEELHKTMKFIVAHSDGSTLDSHDSMWLYMWTVLDKIKSSMECRKHAYEATDKSIYDFIQENWAMLFDELQGNCEKALVKAVIEWQSYYATLWENTSIGSMAVDKEFDGDQLLIMNGGYTRVLNHYLDAYNLRDKILLNSPVTRIERSENGPSLVIAEGVGEFEADIVVVTVSLGVLKKGGIIFNPPLPEEKQESINRLGFGVYDKIFMTFKGPVEAEDEPSKMGFWDPNADVISIVPKADDDYNQFLLNVKIRSLSDEQLSEATQQERRPYDSREPDHIGIEMANLYGVTGLHKIVMLIYGKAAMDMESVAHDNEALTEFALSKLRNAFPDRIIPEVDEVHATTWGNDPYSFGSFANIPVGASGQDMVNLSEPVDDKIFFAGEATFPLHYSTVHGALKSGRREFARIMQKFYPEMENIYANLLEN